MRELIATGLCLIVAGSAPAALQETAVFTSVPSQASPGIASYTAAIAGGYTLDMLDWSGFASTLHSVTWGSELTVDITGPAGFGTQTITLGYGNEYDPGAAFSGSTSAFAGIGDPTGTWTFDLYESFDDGLDSAPDATWDNITFGLHEALPTIWYEGFETSVPPAGWTASGPHSGDEAWHQGTSAFEGSYSAQVFWDPDLAPQDEWLISPASTALATMEVSGQTMGSLHWGAGAPYDNYDLELWIIRGGAYGGGDDDLVGILDGAWGASWAWAPFAYDISSYLTPGETFSLGFRYEGFDGAQGNIDSISLRGVPEPMTLALIALGGLAFLRRLI